jgi:methionyl-tRNA formyltransferase
VPILRGLALEHEVVLVVTQPDKPSGRGLSMTPSPVNTAARGLGLAVETPEKLDDDAVRRLTKGRAEVLACASYGKILPAALVTNPALPALNVHPSALPKYRGATPIQAALLAGDATTAVTVMWMAARMDAGDIALKVPVDIGSDEDYGSLHDRLAEIGARTLLDALSLLGLGELPRVQQDETAATYTRPITKSDLELPLTATSRELAARVRAYSPKPGAWLTHEGKRLKILAASAEPGVTPDAPGTLSIASDGEPIVATVDGLLRLKTVVPEGKRAMSGRDFVRGIRR